MRMGDRLHRLRQPIPSSAAVTAVTAALPAVLAKPAIAATIAAAAIAAAIAAATVAAASIAAAVTAAALATAARAATELLQPMWLRDEPNLLRLLREGQLTPALPP